MALGATRREVVRLVVGSGLSLTAGGILVGGVIAALAARWLAPLLFQHSPWDPAVLGAVVAVLVGIGIVATAVPAFNASRVDPNVTLRSD
jgi:ABC-type antimicrobial peptide transport system permease subunit